MILKAQQPAPDFNTRDVMGRQIQLSGLKGKKVLLTFYRHVGCPVNHLRFLELSQYDKEFSSRNLIVIAVYESTSNNLLQYIENEGFYARFIANPEFDLYEKYHIEMDTLKLLYSMYKGVYARQTEGQKRFKQKFEPEGHRNLLGGDFLIDEKGNLRRVYYNQFLGDHLPVEEILSFLNDPDYGSLPEEDTYCCR